MKSLFKKPLFIVLILAIVFAGAGIYFYSKNSAKSPYEFTTVQRGDLSQEVSVTGRVKRLIWLLRRAAKLPELMLRSAIK